MAPPTTCHPKCSGVPIPSLRTCGRWECLCSSCCTGGTPFKGPLLSMCAKAFSTTKSSVSAELYITRSLRSAPRTKHSRRRSQSSCLVLYAEAEATGWAMFGFVHASCLQLLCWSEHALEFGNRVCIGVTGGRPGETPHSARGTPA